MLGFNPSDERQIALDILKSKSATFPNVLDDSRRAQMVSFDAYRTSGVPANYIIDQEGKIVDGWYGNDWERGLKAVGDLGVK